MPGEVMQAVRVHEIGGPEVLHSEEVARPEPGRGEALVRVQAAGVNFIDIYQRMGMYRVPLPFTPGQEAAGVVADVGPGVEEVAPGDRVAWASVMGAYAEYAVVPAARLVRVPAAVPPDAAAAVMLQGMTAHYLSHSTYPLGPGDRCLVHAAAGGVGLLLVQMAKRLGAYVIGTAGSEEKAARARDAGADAVILYRQQDFVAETRALTGGAGLNVVYDSVGATTFLAGLDLLAPRGMMVLFGASSGAVPPLDPQLLNQKGSLFLTRPTLGHYILTREELLQRAGDVLAWLEDGWLRVRIDRALPLADAGAAHEALAGRQTSGKVLLVPGAG
jgi:NADPH2:quinone reductase